jgi:hypothetical protein
VIPKADEQVGGEAHQCPADEQQQETVRDDDTSIAAANSARKQKKRVKFSSCAM